MVMNVPGGFRSSRRDVDLDVVGGDLLEVQLEFYT